MRKEIKAGLKNDKIKGRGVSPSSYLLNDDSPIDGLETVFGSTNGNVLTAKTFPFQVFGYRVPFLFADNSNHLNHLQSFKVQIDRLGCSIYTNYLMPLYCAIVYAQTKLKMAFCRHDLNLKKLSSRSQAWATISKPVNIDSKLGFIKL